MPRPSAAKRGYGPKWRAARDAFLALNRICVVCKDARRPVKLHADRGDPELGIVDHKIPHKGNLKLFWSRSNWQTMHKRCHDSVKQTQEKSGVGVAAAASRMHGCDEDGVPKDSSHHWNA